jgi:predicted Co/Zn/Cd cation transporter (cation efflux family)
VRQPDDENFNFGYATFEPTLNVVKGLITLILCGFALTSSVGALLSGGRDLQTGPALIYAVIATIGCVVVAGFLRRVARETESPLVDVDAKNWSIDALMSFVVGAAFVAAYLLDGTRFAHWLPYVDPVLVVAMSAALIAIPLKIVGDGVGEILMVAPEKAVQDEVRGRIEAVLEAAGHAQSVIRMVRVGRTFWVMVHVVVSGVAAAASVAELDAIRARVAAAVAEIHPEMTVDTLFTANQRWAGAAVAEPAADSHS